MSGGGGVEIITLRDVYDALMRLSGAVEAARVGNEQLVRTNNDHEGRLRTLEAELSTAKETARTTATTVVDHESRIRDNEKWSRGLPVALVLAAASLLLAAFGVWGH